MALSHSIKEDLIDHIKNAYGANENTISKFLSLLENNPNSYGKLTDTHFTSSAVVVDDKLENILLMHHSKYNKWLAFGGHWNDSSFQQETIFQGAMREMFEEGFNNVAIDFNILNNNHPIDLDIHIAGKDTHYDLAFLVSISKEQQFTLSNEAKSIVWLNIDNIIENRNNLFDKRTVKICENIRKIYPLNNSHCFSKKIM